MKVRVTFIQMYLQNPSPPLNRSLNKMSNLCKILCCKISRFLTFQSKIVSFTLQHFSAIFNSSHMISSVNNKANKACSEVRGMLCVYVYKVVSIFFSVYECGGGTMWHTDHDKICKYNSEPYNTMEHGIPHKQYPNNQDIFPHKF